MISFHWIYNTITSTSDVAVSAKSENSNDASIFQLPSVKIIQEHYEVV